MNTRDYKAKLKSLSVPANDIDLAARGDKLVLRNLLSTLGDCLTVNNVLRKGFGESNNTHPDYNDCMSETMQRWKS